MIAKRLHAAGPLRLDGFNLLPYRERVARALRRRQAAQCGAAILLAALGVGLWTAGCTWRRLDMDAERTRLDARLRQLEPQAAAAKRAARTAGAVTQRDAQAVELAEPHRRVSALLATLAQVRDDTVRIDALHATRSGVVLDVRAASYRAGARWLASVAREQRDARIDVDALKPASAAAPVAAGAPIAFSAHVRWRDATPRRATPGDGA
ncbi:fimbrial assembly family protein [Burkholderia multivorans]|uniref:Fimbrial assembly family protein n=1 Tax=Burkholderia multivorans TaxID=87883 RepID=A0ABD7LG39_9BURK|nr:fimbrial protein [Burkholderia multivorans]MDN7945348.1 fimbrial protein [Burkholderia multivorans]SAK10984.1 fimbrial assembly family protein [Burkholderia multivorans]SAK12633.1 fimbrial assembly family protein [Burkholderia multivorans]HEF5156470.1 fimbrial protein [Burkholderia multivorans]